MCGIAGYIGEQAPSRYNVQATLEAMKNRGPDHQAYRSLNHGDLSIHLLHSRLSILDLDPRSNQPFSIPPFHLVFNGEIYNYREVRASLQKEGYRFETESDTEVLLKSYMAYGARCVDALEGMWSFALFDNQAGTLLLSRDRFGEKPLYYCEDGSGFYFGSEVKFLSALRGAPFAVNRTQLLRYLAQGYKSLYKHEETFFENVHEVPAGTNLTLTAGGKKVSNRYWTPTYSPSAMSLSDAIEGTRHYLAESMKIRLRADVPIAFCLSGGVDSSLLASIAAKQFNYDVTTFSIVDDDPRYNELENIQATVDDLRCRSHKMHLKHDNVLERLEDLVRYHDAPVGTISYLVHSYLSQAISQQGFKVVVSGTAADELFTGYYDHYLLHLHEMQGRKDYGQYEKDWRMHVLPSVRNAALQDPGLYSKNPDFRSHIYFDPQAFDAFFTVPFREDFIESTYSSNLLRNRMLNELFHEVIPVILHEDDLNSMRYSIENRSPYLDTQLFRFAYSIPPEHLIGDGFNKFVLREAGKGVLNDRVRLDRNKKGFNASITSVLDLKHPAVRDFILGDSPIFDILHREQIAALLDIAPMPDALNKFMFGFLNAKLFLEQHPL